MDGRDGEENLASPLGGVGKAADPGSNIDGLYKESPGQETTSPDPERPFVQSWA